MRTIPIILILILNTVVQSFACSCPTEIKCTSDECLIKRKHTIPKEAEKLQTWQYKYYSCNILCLYSVLWKTNCSTIDDLEHVCRCGDKFYSVLSGTNWTCVPHSLCPPGQGVKVQGSGITDTVCEKCVTGKEFSSTNSSTDGCEPCEDCKYPDIILTGCSPTSNTVCQNGAGGTTSNAKSDYPSKNDLKQELGSEQQQITEIIIVSNLAAIVVIIGVISIVMVVLYRKGKLHCLHRTARHGMETILSNEEINIIDNGNPELNEHMESHDVSESYQVVRTRIGTNYDATDSPTDVLYGRYDASGQQNQQCSSHKATISSGSTSSDKRFPKSRSLPQELGSTARFERHLPRNTYSYDEDLQLNRLLQSGGARNPVYPFHRALTDLSYHLCGIEWEMFFRRLIGEGSDEILGRVKRDHARSVREQIYHMLFEWKKKNASEATLNVIIKELEDLNENLLASVYRRKLPHLVYP